MRFYEIKYSTDFYINRTNSDTSIEKIGVAARDMSEATAKVERHVRKRNNDFKPWKEKNDDTGKMETFQTKNLEIISCELLYTSDID